MSSYDKDLDDLDFQILDILIKDSRTPYLEISRICNVSGATIHVRMKKMEELGIIKGSHLVIDSSKLDYKICCFIGVYLNNYQLVNLIVSKLSNVPEITEIHYTTGQYSLFLRVIAKNLDHLQHILLNKIQSIEGIERVDSFISLSQPIDRDISL